MLMSNEIPVSPCSLITRWMFKWDKNVLFYFVYNYSGMLKIKKIFIVTLFCLFTFIIRGILWGY